MPTSSSAGGATPRGRNLGAIGSATVRYLALVALVVLLIFVLLPATLAAAGVGPA